MKNKHSKSHKDGRYKRLIAVLVVLAIAVVGVRLLMTSHAATPYASAYAANGQLASPATLVSGGSNANNQAVQFDSTSTGTGTASGGCTNAGVVAPCINSTTTGASGWGTPKLDDEFTKDSSLNTSIWSPTVYFGGDVQNYTYMYSSNVSVANGYLNLKASGAEGASGSIIDTDPYDGVSGHTGYQFTYGFMEARIDFPASGTQIANWPSFWAVGQDWPEDGEIDVVEGLSGTACYHFHYGANNTAPGNCVSGNYTGWHTFGADWQPGSITFYYDGIDVGSITSGITSQPLFLLAENSTGSYGLLPVTTPADMLMSYVRVWQN
jgi:hypothetical protein